MKITRRQLEKMILEEARLLNEGEGISGALGGIFTPPVSVGRQSLKELESIKLLLQNILKELQK